MASTDSTKEEDTQPAQVWKGQKDATIVALEDTETPYVLLSRREVSDLLEAELRQKMPSVKFHGIACDAAAWDAELQTLGRHYYHWQQGFGGPLTEDRVSKFVPVLADNAIRVCQKYMDTHKNAGQTVLNAIAHLAPEQRGGDGVELTVLVK